MIGGELVKEDKSGLYIRDSENIWWLESVGDMDVGSTSMLALPSDPENNDVGGDGMNTGTSLIVRDVGIITSSSVVRVMFV